MPLHGFRNIGYFNSVWKPLVATGGAVTTYTSGNVVYKVHSFTSGTSNFTVTDLGTSKEVEYLIVAGGAAGGSADNQTEAGAGGGAGGFREGVSSLSVSGSYSIVVGAGGIGRGGSNNSRQGLPGGNSSFNSIVSAGGGGGGNGQGAPGLNGGSGGGSNARTQIIGFGNVPSVTPAQGFNGVRGTGNNGGGGGGAGGNAGAGGVTVSGPGKASSIRSNSPVTYSVGGQGGVGISSGGTAASANTGSAGRGGRAVNEAAGNPNQFMGPGGSGGSGIVVIRYIESYL